MRQRQLQDPEYVKKVLLKLEKIFNFTCGYIVLRALVEDVRLISFDEAQSLPEYQAELEYVRSNSFFFSPSSTTLSDHDVEKYSKMAAFFFFTMERDEDLDLSSDPKPEPQNWWECNEIKNCFIKQIFHNVLSLY